MKVRVVWIGRTRSAPTGQLVREFIERTGRFTRVEVVEIRDRDDEGNRRVEKEAADILSRVSNDPLVVLLDERGKEMTSRELAAFFEKERLAGTKQITFVIGGYSGVSDEVRKRADFTLALSRMTFTHELARVLLMEQVYRAYTIIHDLPYQK